MWYCWVWSGYGAHTFLLWCQKTERTDLKGKKGEPRIHSSWLQNSPSRADVLAWHNLEWDSLFIAALHVWALWEILEAKGTELILLHLSMGSSWAKEPLLGAAGLGNSATPPHSIRYSTAFIYAWSSSGQHLQQQIQLQFCMLHILLQKHRSELRLPACQAVHRVQFANATAAISHTEEKCECISSQA